MTPKKNKEFIITSKCFCGINLYIKEDRNSRTCGSEECNRLAKQFGSVTNWLVTNVQEIGKEPEDIDILNRVELKIVKYLNSTKSSSSQKTIATETGLAKSTVSKSLIRLVKREFIVKNDFYDETGNFMKKGKSIAHYCLNNFFDI